MGPYSPQQNGVVESWNQTVIGAARSMLKATGMARRFWGEAVLMAAYVLNRSPTRNVEGKTPYEAWHGKKPSVQHLQVFSCIAYMKITWPHLSKLDDRGLKMVFISYKPESKAYRLYNLADCRVHVLATSSSMRTHSRAGMAMAPGCNMANRSWWSTSSPSRVKEELLMVLHHHLLQAHHRHRCPH
jgi:hypothetical protein